MRTCFNYLILGYIGLNLLLSSTINAQTQLQVVSTENTLLQYRDNNQLKGPSAEIFKLLMSEAQLASDIDFMPWPRAYKLASTQTNTIVLTMVRTADREDKFHWLIAVSELVRGFISLKSRTDLNLANIEQAKTKLIAVVRDSYGYSSLLSQGFSPTRNLYVVPDMKTAIALFLNEKVDLLYTDPSEINHYFATKKLNSDELINTHVFPETKRQGYIAINRDSDSELVRKLTEAAKRVKQNPNYHYYYQHEPLNDDK